MFFFSRISAASPPYSALVILVQSCAVQTLLVWAAISLENAKKLYEKRGKGFTKEKERDL